MKRVVLLGLPGAGKSHLARLLATELDVEVVHLDRLFATPSVGNESRPEWIPIMEQLVQEPQWIIDGHYTDSIPIRLRAADTVIFVDTPLWLCLVRVWRRQGRVRADWSVNVKERRDLEFLRLMWFVWTSRNTIVDEVYDAFDRYGQHANLIHIGGRRAAAGLIRRLERRRRAEQR